MFVASRLRLSRGGFTLDVASLAIPEGQCVGLVGPNGAGKTTLLGILAGRLRCPGADFAFDGIPIGEFGVLRTLVVGVMPDKLQGIQSLTVREHFALCARFYPGWNVEYQSYLVDKLQIPLDTKLSALSRGTQAKVALVSVEGYRPPVLLLDEPTTGLDPIVRRELRTVLAAALKEHPSRRILFSTHLVEDLQYLADRVLLLRGGRLLSELTIPAEATREERGRLLEGALDLLAGEGAAP